MIAYFAGDLGISYIDAGDFTCIEILSHGGKLHRLIFCTNATLVHYCYSQHYGEDNQINQYILCKFFQFSCPFCLNFVLPEQNSFVILS